jgi:hypothetical protein
VERVRVMQGTGQAEWRARAWEKELAVVLARAYRTPFLAAERQVAVLARAKEGSGAEGRP